MVNKTSKKKKTITIFDMAKNIQAQANKDPHKDYGSGLLGEHLIVSSYKTLSISHLEKMRFLITAIIKEKKIQLKIESQRKADYHAKKILNSEVTGKTNLNLDH